MASDTGPDLLSTSIYIGNLDPSVTEDYIKMIFSKLAPVKRCKLIQGQEHGIDPYCFVEFHSHDTAEHAIATMNGRQVLEKRIRVNWATNAGVKKDTSNDYHIFVGDLSYEIDSNTLQKEFERFGEVTDVRVVRDPVSGKSKGFGFISFKEEMDASSAIKAMKGKLLNGRAIRTNWASRKGPYSPKESRLDYDEVSRQASIYNTTIYVGGLPEITDYQLQPYFQPHGRVNDIRVIADKGYAFVKFLTHDEATQAICQMNGAMIEGNVVKCFWGKETPETVAPLHQQQQYYQYYYQQLQQHQQPQQCQPPQYMQQQLHYTPAASYLYQGYPNQPTVYMQGQGVTTSQGNVAALQPYMPQASSNPSYQMPGIEALTGSYTYQMPGTHQ